MSGKDFQVLSIDAVVLIETILTVVAVVCVILRCVARFVVSKAYGMDDFFIIASVMTTIPYCVLVWQSRIFGSGRSVLELNLPQLENCLKIYFIETILFAVNILTTKICIMTLFLRFLVEKSHRWFIYGLLIFQTVSTFTIILTATFLCKPVSFFWKPTTPGGRCTRLSTVWYVNAGLDTATIIILCVFPSVIVRRLNMRRKDKLYLCIVFALGGFACITSAMRLRAIYNVSRTFDFTINSQELSLWGGLEMNVGMICACLPTFRPLITLTCCTIKDLMSKSVKLVKSLDRSTDSTGSHSSDGSLCASKSYPESMKNVPPRRKPKSSRHQTNDSWTEAMSEMHGARYTWAINSSGQMDRPR